MQTTIDLLKEMTENPINIVRLSTKQKLRFIGFASPESKFPFPVEMLQEFVEILKGAVVQGEYPCIFSKKDMNENPDKYNPEKYPLFLDFLEVLCKRSANTAQAVLYAATLFIEKHPGSLLHEFLMLQQIRETFKLSDSADYAERVVDREESVLLEILQIHDLLEEDTVHFSDKRTLNIQQALDLISDNNTLSLAARKEALLILECYHISRASMIESKNKKAKEGAMFAPLTKPGGAPFVRFQAVSNISKFPVSNKIFDMFSHEIKNFRFLLGISGIQTLENLTEKVVKVDTTEVSRLEDFGDVTADSVYPIDSKTHTMTVVTGSSRTITKPKTLGKHWVTFFQLMTREPNSDPIVLMTQVLHVESDTRILDRWLTVLVEYCKTVKDPSTAPSNYKAVYDILNERKKLPQDACAPLSEVVTPASSLITADNLIVTAVDARAEEGIAEAEKLAEIERLEALQIEPEIQESIALAEKSSRELQDEINVATTLSNIDAGLELAATHNLTPVLVVEDSPIKEQKVDEKKEEPSIVVTEVNAMAEERQAEVERQAAVKRQAEVERRAEVERQAAVKIQAAVKRQAAERQAAERLEALQIESAIQESIEFAEKSSRELKDEVNVATTLSAIEAGIERPATHNLQVEDIVGIPRIPKTQVTGTILSKETLDELRVDNKNRKALKKNIGITPHKPPREIVGPKENYDLTPIHEGQIFVGLNFDPTPVSKPEVITLPGGPGIYDPAYSQGSEIQSSVRKQNRPSELETSQEDGQPPQPSNVPTSGDILKTYLVDSPIKKASPIKMSEEKQYESIADEDGFEANQESRFVLEVDQGDNESMMDSGSVMGDKAYEIFGDYEEFLPGAKDFVNQFMSLFDKCTSTEMAQYQDSLRALIITTLNWHNKAKKDGIIAPTFGVRDDLIRLLNSGNSIPFDVAYEHLYVILQTIFFSDKRKKEVIVDKKPVKVNPATLYPYLQNAAAILMRLGNYGAKKEDHTARLEMFTHVDVTDPKISPQNKMSLSKAGDANDGTAIAILETLDYVWKSDFSKGKAETNTSKLKNRLKRLSQFVSVAMEIFEKPDDEIMMIEEQWLILLASSDYLNANSVSPFYNAIRLLATIYCDSKAWDEILMLSPTDSVPEDLDDRTIVLQENGSMIIAHWMERGERRMSQFDCSNILPGTSAMLPASGERKISKELCHEIKLLCSPVDLLNTDNAQWKEREVCKALYQKLQNFFGDEHLALSRQQKVLDKRIWVALEKIDPQKNVTSEELNDTQSESSRGSVASKQSTFSCGSVFSATDGLRSNAYMRDRQKEDKIEVSNVQFLVLWESLCALNRPFKEREIKFILKNYEAVSQKTIFDKEKSVQLLYKAFEGLSVLLSKKNDSKAKMLYESLMKYVTTPGNGMPELFAQYCLFQAKIKIEKAYVMQGCEIKYIMEGLKRLYIHRDKVKQKIDAPMSSSSASALTLFDVRNRQNREEELKRLNVEYELMDKVAPTVGENSTSAISLVYQEWNSQLNALKNKKDLKTSDAEYHQMMLRNEKSKRIVKPGSVTDMEKISALVTEVRDKAEALEEAQKEAAKASKSWFGLGKK